MRHPTRLELERFSVGDLREDRLVATKEHVDDCPECMRYVAELETARASYLAAVPPAELLTRLKARRSPVVSLADLRARIGAGIATFVVAAAVLLLARRTDDPGMAGGVGLKGAGLAIHRSRDGDVHVLTDEEAVRGGDALRIVITQSHPARLALWFVDAHGRIDRFPREAPLALPAGESALPDSARVDSPCLDLALVVVSSPSSVDEVERHMEEALRGGAPVAGDAWIPRGALVRRLRCE